MAPARLGFRRGGLDRAVDLVGVAFEVLAEHAGEFRGLCVVGCLVGPGASRHQDLPGYPLNRFRHLQTEDRFSDERALRHRSAENAADHGPGVGDRDAMAFAERSCGPSGVDQPDLRSVAIGPLAQHLGVGVGVVWEERLSEAGAERCLRLLDASLGMRDADDESELAVRFARIRSAAQHGAELTGQMLTYSGKTPFSLIPTDLSRVVEQTRDLLEASIARKGTLRLDITAGLPLVDGDEAQLRQVIVNLVNNAAEAVGDVGGTVRVSTGVEKVGPAELALSIGDADAQPGEYVVLTVEDSGPGMDDAMKDRIFDPFYTTRRAGRGLGLPAVLGIVRGHGGAIVLESRPGEGTRFRVLLRRSERALESVRRVPAPVASSRPKGAVLVVDDEQDVLEIASEFLKRAGFRVEAALGGRDALAIVGRDPGAVDAIVLDLVMPDLDGEQTLRLLREIAPGVPVILTSGYDEERASQRFAPDQVLAFLRKPYAAEQLIEKVEQALLARGRSRARAARSAPRCQRLARAREAARHLGEQLGHALRLRGLPRQHPRHARSPRLQRGHLPHADGCRQRGDADGRREGRRGTDPQALPGLPAAPHPIFTFVNKMDRFGRDGLDLMSEIEDLLGIDAVPVNWPIGAGKDFRGVYDRIGIQRALLFSGRRARHHRRSTSGSSRADRRSEAVERRWGEFYDDVAEHLELLDGAGAELDLDAVSRRRADAHVLRQRAHQLWRACPSSSASSEMAPVSSARAISDTGPVDPVEHPFSGFVFKIQANMDKDHRDRIAFLRICSGRFVEGRQHDPRAHRQEALRLANSTLIHGQGSGGGGGGLRRRCGGSLRSGHLSHR